MPTAPQARPACGSGACSRGPYATYFIPTINCVSLTNELLEKTDIGRTVMLGLKTPGAYLDLLEREYLAGNPAVTARRVYDKI